MEREFAVLEERKVTPESSQAGHGPAARRETALRIFEHNLPYPAAALPDQRTRVFTLFGKLRFKIWNLNMPQAQLIRLSFYRELETLRHYQFLFKEPSSFESLELPMNLIYFDPAVDTLVLDTRIGFWGSGSICRSLAENRESMFLAQSLIINGFRWEKRLCVKALMREGLWKIGYPEVTVRCQEKHPRLDKIEW
ncbi:hypothetical protein N431DRAFT_464615 [Stipitochalara longipes BDJ]|nr:hypothetical protein N431DRAFT_464615 [Stipitochalara longipes BDJ]